MTHAKLDQPLRATLSDGSVAKAGDRRVLVARGLQIFQLTIWVAAFYLLVAFVTSEGRTDRARPGLALSIGATAVVALSFGHIKRASAYVANRIVFGKRAAPIEVVGEFTDRIVREYSGNDLIDEMAKLIARGTGAERSAVWLLVGDQLRVAASSPADGDGTGSVQVNVEEGGQVLGAFTITKPPTDRVTASDVKLLTDLASIAGVVFRNLLLQAEIQARVDELHSQSLALLDSRRRIVEAQDEERRALERDIHDGGQQYLTALGMRLGHAKILLSKDPPAVPPMMREIDALATEALAAIADLSVSLYPTELIDEGVLAALRQRASRFPFEVWADGTAARYNRELEACVYFVCLEAVQNAAKHARPSRVSINIAERDKRLIFVVADDGSGFEVSKAQGTGLRNMGDRLAAYGGLVEFASSPGGGTRVIGSVPLTDSRS